MELARRAAQTFAADSAETQPLSSPMSSAVAAVLSKPDDARPAEDLQPTIGPVQRSLQKDFESSGVQNCLGLPDNQLGDQEMEMPDNQLGEYPEPLLFADSLDEQQAPEQAVVTSVFDDPYAEQVVVTSVFDDADPEQLPLEPRDDQADGATVPALTQAPSLSAGSEEPAMAEAELLDMPAKGLEDESSASDPMDADVDCPGHKDDAENIPGQDLVEEMLEADERLDEEPPLVTRRKQWGLKPAPKRRGRRPATPQAAAPKPKAPPQGPRWQQKDCSLHHH